jgi:hypothetical protein
MLIIALVALLSRFRCWYWFWWYRIGFANADALDELMLLGDVEEIPRPLYV